MIRRVLSITLAIILVQICPLANAASPSSQLQDQQSYDGFSVYRVEPKDEDQLAELQRLMDDESLKIVYWREPVAVGEFVDILAGPDAKEALMARLNDSSMDLAEIVEDIGLKLKATTSDDDHADDDDDVGQVRSTLGSFKSVRQGSAAFTSKYLSYSEIISRIESLVASSPSRASLEAIGKSYEGRNLYVVKISGTGAPNKPVVFIDAGHHAREWISPAVGLYTIESLLLGGNRARNSLGSSLRNFDLWIMPLVNPDGYEYSRTRNRLWRKTRSKPARKTSCSSAEDSFGVDPNRNYPAYWGLRGSSRSPCSEIYAGPSALSEPETKAIAEVLSSNARRIVMYVSLHSYAQLVLAPFGYKDLRPDNFHEHQRIANSFIDSVRRASGTRYGFGTAAGLMGAASGGSDDYAKLKAKIRISFTIELPDRDVRIGFLMPPSRIKSIGHETTVGLRSMFATLEQILDGR